MSEEKILTELETHENPMLAMTAEKGESELKDFLVDFVVKFFGLRALFLNL